VTVAPADTLAGPERVPSVLTVGFGTAVAMWGVGYVGRLPAVMLPAPLLLGLLLACLVAGGGLLARHAAAGGRDGALAGLLAGTINLLVLGSFVAGEGAAAASVPSALLWLPGSILVAAALAGAGAIAGRRWLRPAPVHRAWTSTFVRVAIGAVLLLLGVGGLVTSTEAGLAVVDWPNSFGYNMFLYPFSRMTGGVYYEHAHRLFGALVGLTVLVLALLLQLREPRPGVRRLGWVVLAMVIVQGVMGGLRVTGGFTTSASPEAMRPSLGLALVHGVFGQCVFAALVVLGAWTSPAWRRGRTSAPALRSPGPLDRVFAAALVVLLIGQLLLGAAERHLGILLIAHIVLGVAVVAPAALHAGFRAWGRHEGHRPLQRTGLALSVAIAMQVVLGLGAFVALRAEADGAGGGAGVLLATAHQVGGAVVLGLAVLLACWSFRRQPRGESPAAG
jgi:cytochrome c oxidase assembly protein subunit 15